MNWWDSLDQKTRDLIKTGLAVLLVILVAHAIGG